MSALRGGIFITAAICGILRLMAQGAGASVAGVVVDEATGAAVRKAVVELYRLGVGKVSAQDVSDAQGHFGFSNLPPGKYRIVGSKEGYEPKMLGANHSGQPGTVLTLAAGDTRWNLRLAIRPFGAITGRVVDGDGDPWRHVQVEALQQGWYRGKPQWQIRRTSWTDDRGEYRLLVPAGKYCVTASKTQPDSGPGEPAGYAMQIYPGTDRVSKAALVETVPGREASAIDFHLIARPAAVLRGHVIAPEALQENDPVNLQLIPRDGLGVGQASVGGMASGKDRAIQMQGAAPGPYRLVASATVNGAQWRSVTEVELNESSDELTVPLYPGVDLSGSVAVEGPGAERYRRFDVWLVPGEDPPGSALHAKTSDDGTFTVKDVTMGIWDINVMPIPKGGYLKSMKLGDQDVLTEDMTITPDTSAPLTIMMSTLGARVAGDVDIVGEEGGKQAIVLLAPEGRFSRVLSFYRGVLADEKGHFEIQGIGAGTYRAYAFEELGDAEWRDPEFLKQFAGRGEAVTLGEGRAAGVKLKLIRAGEWGNGAQ